MKQLNYAGIGSRETPDEILHLMFHIGQDLGAHGWNLRSGYAGGADMAFFNGAVSVDGKMEMFLPWAGFNQAPNDSRFISDEASKSELRRWFYSKSVEINFLAATAEEDFPEVIKSIVLFPKSIKRRCTLVFNEEFSLIQIN